VICEIMNDDGTMARMPDLEASRQEARALILTIADLIQYRLQTERLVRRVAERTIASTRRARSGRPWCSTSSASRGSSSRSRRGA
jgi:hypothetical protein